MSDQDDIIDLCFALNQLNNNEEMLGRLLTKFRDEFISVPKQVKAHLQSDDLINSKLKVHTTKGLAGNLGLSALYNCSKDLDKQLKEGTVDYQLVDRFAKIMALTCDYISTQKFKNHQVQAESVQAQINQYLPELKQCLESREFIDDERLIKYVGCLAISEKDKNILIQWVEELNYSDALEFLNTKLN